MSYWGIPRIPFPGGVSGLFIEGPDTRQWRERKQRPTSLGDKKNRPKPKKVRPPKEEKPGAVSFLHCASDECGRTVQIET